MKKLQVAILISGRGSNLESLIQSSFKKQSLVEVQLVVSNNSKAKGLTIANKNKIPIIHFIPRKNIENKVKNDNGKHDATSSFVFHYFLLL